MRIAARDENIKAIVIRIDSPGGSCAGQRSDVAGGSSRRREKAGHHQHRLDGRQRRILPGSAGDKIFADPSAVVGSIGVVGGKFVFKGISEWAGIHTEIFSKGKNAGLV